MDIEKIPPEIKEREKRKFEVASYLCDKFSTIRRDRKRQKEENKMINISNFYFYENFKKLWISCVS